jgi:DNA-binding NtrC family response regulator
LAQHFLDMFNRADGTSKKFSASAIRDMASYSWPGNVRELKNVIQRAYILAEGDIGLDSLPLGVAEEAPAGTGLLMKVGTSISEAERRLVLATLEHFEGDKKKAAAVLKISLKTLYNRLNVYNAGA